MTEAFHIDDWTRDGLLYCITILLVLLVLYGVCGEQAQIWVWRAWLRRLWLWLSLMRAVCVVIGSRGSAPSNASRCQAHHPQTPPARATKTPRCGVAEHTWTLYAGTVGIFDEKLDADGRSG